MRNYAQLFNVDEMQWSVIYTDGIGGTWYIYISRIEDETTAKEIVEAMTLKSKMEWESMNRG